MMHAPVAIRPATKGDLPAVLRLLAQDDTHRAGLTGVAAEAHATPSGAHLSALEAIQADPNNHVYVAELDGVIVGTFQLTFIRQLSYGGCLVAQIESVFVCADARSRGIGRSMMDYAREEAERRGALRVQLTSNSARERAHRFYERLGYLATHKGMKLYLDRPPREGTTERQMSKESTELNGSPESKPPNGSQETSRFAAGLEKSTEALTKVILDVVAFVPKTNEHLGATPRERAKAIQTAASLKAAAVSGTLSLPSGPFSFAVILPDLISVWRIQAQMVADIAGAYGQSAHLSQEHMVYCLFRHAAAQIVRDLAARVGQRVVIQRATARALQAIARRLGIRVSRQMIAKSAARWLPIVGSIGVAGYAYYDTAQVAATATELFDTEAA